MANLKDDERTGKSLLKVWKNEKIVLEEGDEGDKRRNFVANMHERRSRKSVD